jgi:acetyltransferase-like isoleucine patch superfamily enzyme
VPENAIAVGVPARVVGYRQETDEGSFAESSSHKHGVIA